MTVCSKDKRDFQLSRANSDPSVKRKSLSVHFRLRDMQSNTNMNLCTTLNSRSEKVKNCLGQLVSEAASQCPCSKNRRRRFSKRIRRAGESVRTFVSRLGKDRSGGDEVGRPEGEEAEEEEEEAAGNGGPRTRHRSMSCPSSLLCRASGQAAAGSEAAAGPAQPLEAVTNNKRVH